MSIDPPTCAAFPAATLNGPSDCNKTDDPPDSPEDTPLFTTLKSPLCSCETPEAMFIVPD